MIQAAILNRLFGTTYIKAGKYMKTLIELYDKRPIENVLGTEVFGPEETVFICPAEIAQNKNIRRSLEYYFKLRGCNVKLTFVPVSLLQAMNVAKKIREILETRKDCVIDISGGTDAALFAAGTVAGETPVITYSHKQNRFFEIHNAPYARNLPCNVRLNVETCFLMAGGRLKEGRANNSELASRLDQIEKLFNVYRNFRKIWNQQISYFQKISSAGDPDLKAHGPRTARADNRHVTANEDLLKALEQAEMIHDLQINEEEVDFRFADSTVRFWLRDMGAVLELHVYRACVLAGCYDDVVLSAVVDWDETSEKRDRVSNELDVVAVKGVHPVFISCKTSEIRTEALNELKILNDRFGGEDSRAIIVTSTTSYKNRRIMHLRAAELGIEVIEWNDLEIEHLVRRLS